MADQIESLMKKTQKHIEAEIRKFDFSGYFGKPYKKIRNRLAKKYAEDIISEMWEAEDVIDLEQECNYYLNDNIWTGGAWEEEAEDYILRELEDELAK